MHFIRPFLKVYQMCGLDLNFDTVAHKLNGLYVATKVVQVDVCHFFAL